MVFGVIITQSWIILELPNLQLGPIDTLVPIFDEFMAVFSPMMTYEPILHGLWIFVSLEFIKVSDLVVFFLYRLYILFMTYDWR